jgi:prepilin peptidase CpaA
MTSTMPPMIASVIMLGLVPALCIYSCFSDMFTMRISNRVCLTILALFGVFAIVTTMPLSLVGWHLLAGTLVLCVAFSLFAFGWIGGGDAKLVSAVSVWIGFDQLWEYIALSSLLGGFLTLGIMIMRSHPLPLFAMNQSWMVRLHDKKSGVPYGMALGITALIIWPFSSIWSATF